MRVLIVTGHDHFHHRWRAAATRVRETLEDAGFDVRVTEEFRGASAATLEPYDCVVVSYFGALKPGDPEQRWGVQTEQALFDFVCGGRGIVLAHPAFAMGRTWDDAHGDELLRLAGGLLHRESRRAPEEQWVVTVDEPEHAITRGLPTSWEQVTDDKFVNMRWHPDAKPTVLASLYDDPASYLNGAYYAVDGAQPGSKLYDPVEVAKLPGVGQRHPVVWTNTYGDGRVFALTIGHVGASTLEDAHATLTTGREVGPTIDIATRTEGFVTLLRRGTEWAATGSVTL